MSSTSSAPAARFPALRYTIWLVAPLAVVCVFAKVHKLVATPGGDLGSGLAALFPDVLFIAAYGALTWALLRYLRGAARAVARVAMHLATLVLTTLVFIEHGFWITTGTLLDAYTLGYGLEHIGPLGKVYLSEMGVRVWLGFFLLLAVHYLPLRSLRRDATATRARGRVGRAMSIAALAVLPACTAVAALAVEVAPPVEPLVDNVVVELASEALAPDRAEADDAQAADRHDELVLGAGTPTVEPTAGPANVLIVVMESTRARSTTLHDPALDTTPFLVSLAGRGASVDTAWTAVTHTSKAIVGALCGIFPKLDVPIDEAEPTGLPPTCLAHLLRERGYATGFVQTATGHFERRDQLVTNMGYETFVPKEAISQRGFEETSYFGWEDEALVEPTVQWARQQVSAKKPFFLTVLTLSTHHTYGVPTRFPKKQRASGPLDDYLNAVSYMDGALGKLFAGLEEAGALERTLVIVTGDHGEGFGEHGRFQHDSVVYEEGLHIPMVVVGPGVKPGAHIGGLRSLVDIEPTVLEWLGTPVVAGLPGKSLLTSDGHDVLYASCWLRQRCMATRDATTKFVWHFDKQGPELFDLTADPLEKKNLLASTPEATWAPMRDRLLAWRADNHARWAAFFAVAARDFVTTLPPTPSRPLDVRFSAAAVPDSADGAGPRPLVRLVGIDVPQTTVTSGEPIRVTLHWEVLGPLGGFAPFTHLLGKSEGTRPRYNADHAPVGGRHPTSAWTAGTFVSDEFRIQPSQDLPPGKYELVVGLWDSSSKATGTGARALVDTSTGAPSPMADGDQRVHLLEIEVTPAKKSTGPPPPK